MAPMKRRTIRLNGGVRSSVLLEPEFWFVLESLAQSRDQTLSSLLRYVERLSPGSKNFASSLRTYALMHALGDEELWLAARSTAALAGV